MNRFRKFFSLNKLAAAGLVSVAIVGGTSLRHASCLTSQEESPMTVPSYAKWDRNWDKREPETLVRRSRHVDRNDNIDISPEDIKAKTAKATRHIVLIRHGQYNLDGTTDKEHYLTAMGQEQAKMTGKRLKELGIKFDSIVASDMTRAQQTAELIHTCMNQPGLFPVTCDPILQEGAPALPDPPHEQWNPSLHEFYSQGARIEAAFRKYIHRAEPTQEQDSHEIIVCHGNVIRYFVCRALQFPGQAWLRMNICHSSITVLSVLPTGHVIVSSFSDAGHLPVERVSLT